MKRTIARGASFKRAIAEEASLYIGEILRVRDVIPEKSEAIYATELGERIAGMVLCPGWKDVEKMIIDSMSHNMKLLLLDTPIKDTGRDMRNLCLGHIAGYSFILKVIGMFLFIERLFSRRRRLSQGIVDYLRGFNRALINVTDYVYGAITKAHRMRQKGV